MEICKIKIIEFTTEKKKISKFSKLKIGPAGVFMHFRIILVNKELDKRCKYIKKKVT